MICPIMSTSRPGRTVYLLSRGGGSSDDGLPQGRTVYLLSRGGGSSDDGLPQGRTVYLLSRGGGSSDDVSATGARGIPAVTGRRQQRRRPATVSAASAAAAAHNDAVHDAPDAAAVDGAACKNLNPSCSPTCHQTAPPSTARKSALLLRRLASGWAQGARYTTLRIPSPRAGRRPRSLPKCVLAWVMLCAET